MALISERFFSNQHILYFRIPDGSHELIIQEINNSLEDDDMPWNASNI